MNTNKHEFQNAFYYGVNIKSKRILGFFIKVQN